MIKIPGFSGTLPVSPYQINEHRDKELVSSDGHFEDIKVTVPGKINTYKRKQAFKKTGKIPL